MKKKLAFILATSIFFGSSFSVLATESIAEEIETRSNKQVILQLDSNLAWVDGLEYNLTTNPKVIEGRTYLPLRFMGDMLLEAQVDWDPISKTVIINKDGKKVEVTIGSKEAYINGDQYQIGNAPIIVKDSAYLPVRATSDLFNIHTHYDEGSRQVILTKLEGGSIPIPKPPVVKKPTAQFSFEKDEYTEGQTVKAIDSSFHEDGKPITNRLWMIDFNENMTNSKLENMFSKPKAGKYLISLKVEAGKGNWSEWTTKEILVKPNKKPVITSLEPLKNEYAGGEPMDFTYTFDNEPWEGIKSIRWTYRQEGEAISRAVVEKPKYIFQPGRYIVTLQLQDDYGNWSDVKETYVNISQEVMQSELEYRFTQGKPGDIIDNFNNFNYLSYESVRPDTESFKRGSLFVSNSPENVRQKGILYRDTVSGDGRILLHHHNSFTAEENTLQAKKLVLVAENTSDEPAILTISNRVEKGPSSDILFVGAQLLYDYLKGAQATTYYLSPGEKRYIYDSANRNWGTGQLLSAKMDFNVTGSVTLTSAVVDKTDKIDGLDNLQILERDVHPRGTFDTTGINYNIVIDEDKPTRLSLGAGAEEWVTGIDALTGKRVQNRGNFAVNYRIQITAKEDTGILLNPRAGLFRGALKWDDGEAFLAPSNGYIMGHSSKAVMLGVIKAGETRTLQYSLPNGSASPVLLVFMPKDSWDK